MTLHGLVEQVTDDAAFDMGAHLLVLYSIARFMPAQRIVEIGCDDGSSTIPLVLAAKETGGHVYSVDIAECPEADRRVRESGCRARWSFSQVDSVRFADAIAPDALDLVLVDGDHSYEGCLADWTAYKAKVRVGGMMLFHDTTSPAWPGVAQVVAEHVGTDRRWEQCTMPYGWGLTMCRRIA